MDRIDLHNYEAYMLDFMEGNLSEDLTIELMEFATKYPELEIDIFNNVADLTFQPRHHVYTNKAGLKVSENEAIFDLMIEEVEGNLSENQRIELKAKVEDHNLQKEYAYFKATKLKPNKELVFANKADLKVETGKVIAVNFWRIGTVAAAAVVAIIVLALNLNGSTNPIQSPAVFGSSTVDILTPIKTNITNHSRGVVDQDLNETVQLNQRKNRLVQEERILPNLNVDSLPIEIIEPLQDDKNIVKINPNQDSVKLILPDLLPNDDLAVNESVGNPIVTKESQPYSLVTNALEKVIHNDVAYVKKEISGGTNSAITHSFQIGRFSFERKISN